MLKKLKAISFIFHYVLLYEFNILNIDNVTVENESCPRLPHSFPSLIEKASHKMAFELITT